MRHRYRGNVGWEWATFTAFIEDMGPRPAGARLKRLDKLQPFGPGNAIWAPRRDFKPAGAVAVQGKSERRLGQVERILTVLGILEGSGVWMTLERMVANLQETTGRAWAERTIYRDVCLLVRLGRLETHRGRARYWRAIKTGRKGNGND